MNRIKEIQIVLKEVAYLHTIFFSFYFREIIDVGLLFFSELCN